MSLRRCIILGMALYLSAGASVLDAQVVAGPLSDVNIHLRGPFQNARLRFEREKKGHVAFIGGSITEMNGYRPKVMAVLGRRFPETEFTFTDAGVASTCSTTGAFRLHDDVLSQGPVDLFFVEFAVNDDQDAHHAYRECLRGMEGIVRHTRRHNPRADIVIVYFINPGMLDTWQSGQAPLSVRAHDEVARHYGIATINLARETAEQIKAGTLTWKQYGGTHPGPIGNTLCATMIDRLMSLAWDEPIPMGFGPRDHSTPKALDSHSYFHGRLIAPGKAEVSRDMVVQTPDWSKLKGACRQRFAKLSLLCAEKPGAELTLAFEGTAVGAYVLAGPDAGIATVSIDGAPAKAVNLFHDFSTGLHYPRTVMFDADLEPGKHVLRLRISDDKDARSSGYAMRVLHFVENPSPRP